MDKKVFLRTYRNERVEKTISNFENAIMVEFEIISGDGVLTVIYPDKVEIFDSDINGRFHSSRDYKAFIKPQNIDLISQMESEYDTEKISKVALDYLED